MITQQTPWGVLGLCKFSKRLCVYICVCLFACVCVCVCMYLKISTDFLCSAPEIAASPADELELALFCFFFGGGGGAAVWAADKQVSHIFPWLWERILQGPAAACSATGLKGGTLISSRHSSLCREGAGWCNAVCAAPESTYQMLCGGSRQRNQCDKNTYIMVLWGIVIFNILEAWLL